MNFSQQKEVYTTQQEQSLSAKEQRILQYKHAHLQQLRLLIAHGADVNAIRDDGESLFTQALSEGHVDICDVLLDNENTDLTIYKNKYGQNVLHMALSSKSPQIAERFDRILDKVIFPFHFSFR